MQNNITTEQLAEQENKSRIKNQLMFIKIQQVQNPPPSDAHQCRICLENQTQNSNPLINPCGCDGSVKFVHEKCMKRWIFSIVLTKRKEERRRMVQRGIQCEMCKFTIMFQMKENIGCKSTQQIQQLRQERHLLFTILLVLLIISIIGIISTTYYVVDYILFSKEKEVSFFFSLVLGADVLLLLIFIVGFLVFITEFLLQKSLQIENITRMKNPPILKKKLENKRKTISINEQNSFQQIQPINFE